MESSFVQGLINCLQTFMATLAMYAVMGLIGFAMGEIFPRRLVRYDKFPYNEYKWEMNGQLYLKLKVNKWKDKVPDMSTYFKGMFYKKSLAQARTSEYFERFVIETCVAESVHVLLMISAFAALIIFRNIWGLIASILYSLGNLPFVLIQRYNRPRFKVLMIRQKQIDEFKRRIAAKSQEDKN